MKNTFITAVLLGALLFGGWFLRAHNVNTLFIPPDAMLPDGGRYYGDVLEGKFHGKGKILWPDGSRYEGEFLQGLFAGKGEWLFAAGDIYTGEFKDGMMAGTGKMQLQTGSVYVGAFARNMPNGQGVLEDHNGSRYEGEFADWEFHGKGTYYGPEKDSYRGDFVKGKFTGTGSYEDAAGNRYEGGFRNWIFHGAGVYTSAAGGRYSGQFIDGAPVKGVFQSSEGEKYEGGFNNWLYEGTGVYIDAEGNRYSGEFVSGYYHGKGELVYAKPAADGAEKLSGEWQFGQFQDPAEAAKGATFEQAVEQALYQQNELLERNWRELISGAPAAIDLYFVGVAGYGEQDVFLKEVRFIRELFDRQFGTVGRSLLLVNNPQTMAEIPLATRTGLERTLHAVAAKMDPQQDILFLYLTSHGSATHELSINQNGIVLPDLSAEQLGEILDKLPVRWKVVIVSACYSGGFIPYLENEHTLVMTAASANRKSFGCSDTSEMTYFGKAYFKEALPQAQSFQQAFVSAKQLIQEWEQEEIKTNGGKHSKPQIAAGTAILLYLEQWWRQRRQAASAEKTIAR